MRSRSVTIGAMIGWVVLDFRRLNAQLDQATRALDSARGGAKGARAPMSVEAEAASPRAGGAGSPMLPLVVFMALAWLLFQRLGAGDPASIPSVLIGQSAPPLNLPGLDGAKGLTDADLRAGHVSLVNVFGSWCEPCHFEHQYLMALAADPELKAKGVAIYGVAQKDSAENIRRFLGAKGDPYTKGRSRPKRPRRHRLGRLRRARDLHRQGRRQAGLQARRAHHRRDARERGQAADPEGDELDEILEVCPGDRKTGSFGLRLA